LSLSPQELFSPQDDNAATSLILIPLFNKYTNNNFIEILWA